MLTIERVVPKVEPELPSELSSIISNTVQGDMADIFSAYHELCAVSLLTLDTAEEDGDGVSAVL